MGFPPFPDQNPANIHAASSGTNLLFLVLWVAIGSSIGLILGHGLWTLKRWARIGELLVLGCDISIQIQSIASNQVDFGQLVVQIIVLIYLLQPRVNCAFQ